MKEKTEYLQKENMYKNQLNSKQKEIVKLQTKIKVLNANSNINKFKFINVNKIKS